MSHDFFMRLCDVYGFAPSGALRELVDRAVGQAVIAERQACARVCDEHASIEGIAQRCAAAIHARSQA